MKTFFTSPMFWIATVAFAVCLTLILIFGADKATSVITSTGALAAVLVATVASICSAIKANSSASVSQANAENAALHAQDAAASSRRATLSSNLAASKLSSPNLIAAVLVGALFIVAASVTGCAGLDPTANKVYPPTTQGTLERVADQLEAAYQDAVDASEFAYGLGAITPEQYAAIQVAQIPVKSAIDQGRNAAYAGVDDAQTLLNEAAQELVNLRNQRTNAKLKTAKLKLSKAAPA